MQIHSYTTHGHSKSALYEESRSQSQRQPLTQRDNDGYNTILTVDNDGYRLAAGRSGAVLRQGQSDGSPASIFGVYDSMAFDAEPMKVITAGATEVFSDSFTEYERTYGYGRVSREVKRTFYVYISSLEGDETAFGLVEHFNGKSLAIHSLYYPYKLSRKERTIEVIEYVKGLLAPTEHASITAAGLNPQRVNMFAYDGVVRVNTTGYNEKLEQSRLLFDDAAERRSSLKEVFEEPVKYTPQGVYGNAEAGEANENGKETK